MDKAITIFACLILLFLWTKSSLACARPNPKILEWMNSPEGRVKPGNQSDTPNPPKPPNSCSRCGTCGPPINVTMVVSNQYQAPHFNFSVEIVDTPQRELIYQLQDAANVDSHFKFSADFYPSLGYMITAVNGLRGSVSDKTYWQIVEMPAGNGLNLGVSSYVPISGQTIMFNFTTWGDNH